MRVFHACSALRKTIGLRKTADSARDLPARRAGRWIVVAGLTVVSCSGCVRRRLTVRTTPPGAVVSVDNQTIGTTPAASSFVYYGTREIRIEKDGYRTETLRRRLNPPWYEIPPLDFIAETLWPWEIRDERVIDVELVPRQIEPMEDVVSRADQLRSQGRSGVVTGTLEQPLPTVTLPSAPAPIGLPPGGLPAVISQ